MVLISGLGILTYSYSSIGLVILYLANQPLNSFTWIQGGTDLSFWVITFISLIMNGILIGGLIGLFVEKIREKKFRDWKFILATIFLIYIISIIVTGFFFSKLFFIHEILMMLLLTPHLIIY